MTSTNPYADAYDAYWRAGWRGVLPLPYKAKKHPPTGYTGRNYAEPSYADCATWAEAGTRNIALHLPRGVIGIDVDDYAGKGGGATLSRLVTEHGPLPPTWLSTSRGDGISGIRLFRIPDDVELISALPGIEIVQAHHRYVVCWPSIHPETAATYEWVDEATGERGVPGLTDLPALPGAWLAALIDDGTTKEKATVEADDITRFLAGLPGGDPCQHVVAAAGYAMSGKDRHDAYNGAMLGVLDRGRSGCPGAVITLQRLKASFIAEITAPGTSGRRTEAEANAEWGRGMVGGIGIALAEHPEQGHGCPDDYLAELILTEQRQQEPAEATDDKQDAYRLAVARKAGELQLLDDAREVLAVRKAGQAPPLDAQGLSAFLAQPDEEVPYRIGGLWPVDGRVLLAAAAKAGKTTLVTNLLKALADGGTFLGCFDVAPLAPGRTIVYLNMEVSAKQMRRWLRRSGIDNQHIIHVVNLRGRASALTLGTEQGRQRVAEWLRSLNAGMVILDPLAPLLASLGFEENDNSQVARFFSLWSETLAMADVGDDLIVHHTGHAGQRSRGAARFLDEPDALWTISKDTAVDEDGDEVYDALEPRFFKATGRDVEQPEQPLLFDGVTGVLTLGNGSRKAIRAEAKHNRVQAAIMARLEQGHATQNDLTRKLGFHYNDVKQTLESLLADDVVRMSKVGQANVYTKGVVAVDNPTDTRHQTDTNPLVSVTDTTPYRGVSTSVGADTEKHPCEDCGNDTGKPGLIICSGCEKERRGGTR